MQGYAPNKENGLFLVLKVKIQINFLPIFLLTHQKMNVWDCTTKGRYIAIAIYVNSIVIDTIKVVFSRVEYF